MNKFTIKIEAHTTTDSLDGLLRKIYSGRTVVELNWDLTELTFLDLKKA